MKDQASPTVLGVQNRLSWRAAAVAVHRYVGLAMTVFLVVAGLTGSALSYYHELDAALNPGLLRAAVRSDSVGMLELEELRRAIHSQLPGGLSVEQMPLGTEPGDAVAVWAEPEGAKTSQDDEFFFDPYTGQLLGSRKWGDLSQGRKNLMPFLYRLHFALALGDVGEYLMGVIALLWTMDCFVGASLTLPPGTAKGQGSFPYLRRWRRAWLIRKTHLFSFVFSWHRASGLWVWAFLFVFAWSAVGLNLTEVYQPVMKATFGMDERASQSFARLNEPRLDPELSYDEAMERARELLASQAAEQGFEVINERHLRYDASTGAYRYRVYSSLDISARYPNTTLYLDGDDGRLLSFESPLGKRAGTAITAWLYHLHWGSVTRLGLPYRVFVSVMGLVVSGLSVTGVWVWWRKRKKRLAKGTKKKSRRTAK